jgi:drug/metabolite transporter (DMT)-like permease
MKISDLLELVLLAAIWGASFLFTRIAAPVLEPVLLIELRVLLAGLALLILSIRCHLLAEIKKQLITLFLVGCFNSAIPFLLFAYASLYLPVGFSAILNATAPLLGTIVNFIWLREKLTLSKFGGLIIGFAGVTVLVGWTNITVTSFFVFSIIAGLLATLLYAIAASWIEQNLSGVPPLAIATGSQISAALFLLPITPFFLPPKIPSMKVMLVTLALALFSTALAYLLYFRLIKNVGVSKALTVTYLIPLFAMLWGAIMLKEAITPSMIIGCSFILTGIAIALSTNSN